jgi:arylsulfatase A-like enzyme
MAFMSLDLGGGIEDRRPLGSAEDIAALQDRDDLNILFIMIDTLRADRLGSYGHPRDTSPTMDRLAGSGIRFDRHLAQSSWTKASMASLWTSLHPPRAGITRFDHVLPEEAESAAERLRDAGFRTIGLYRNGWVAPTFGFEQGFEVYSRPALRKPNPSVRAENPTIGVVGTDEDTIAAAIEFLRLNRRAEQPWFLYLHLMDVHEYLYDEESAIFGGRYIDKYDSSIRWTDGTIETLLAYLTEWELDDDTLIVLVSDHGEAFRERGLEGHARAVYRETTEVPLILSFPFRLEPGAVVTTRTQNVDVWPTLLDLLGLEVPEDVDGRSRRPEILAAARGEANDPEAMDVEARETGFAHLDGTWGHRDRKPRDLIAVTEGKLRYLRSAPVAEGGETLEELFDASTDPAELENLIEERPEDVARLRALAEERLADQPPWGESPRRDINELELNQLRALGYQIE